MLTEILSLTLIEIALIVAGSFPNHFPTRSAGRDFQVQIPPRKQSANNERPNSVVGIYLNVITQDRFGDVWVGGSIWLQEALLVHHDPAQSVAATLSDVTTIQDLVFTSHREGWMIGNYKSVYKTINGGERWEKSFTSKKRLLSICFADRENGWAVGSEGAIYCTNNGGVSWRKQAIGNDCTLEQVLFRDSERGWALGLQGTPSVGNRSVLFRTDNGGQTWQNVQSCPALRRITFINRSLGWGIDLQSIFRTTDGGETWTIQRKGQPLSLSSLFFLNDRDGWVLGQDTLRTWDGGMNWVRLKASDMATHYRQVIFVDRMHGWAIGSGIGPDCFRTDDGGNTWEEISDNWKKAAIDKVYNEKFRRRHQ